MDPGRSGGRRGGFTDQGLPQRIAELGLDYSASEEPDPLSASGRIDAVQLGAGIGGGLLLRAGAGLAVARTRPPPRTSRNRPLWMKIRRSRWRRWQWLVPVLLLAGAGFASSRAGRFGLLGAAALSLVYCGVLLAVTASEEMQRTDWRAVAEEFGEADGTRLWVVPANGDDPLLYYAGTERLNDDRIEAGVRSSEIVAATAALSGRVDPPRGFRATYRGRVPPLFLWELRADRPRVVTGAEVQTLLKDRSAALIDLGP